MQNDALTKIINKLRDSGGLESRSPKTTMKYELLRQFLKDDRGEHAMEFLMILTFGVLPFIAAVFLLRDIIQEYVAVGQIFVSSPFF